ncbi:DUF3375 domain-containing protein [Chitinophaga nivalis]|uniref:DUF3375 domain-containing protein n=1 Tax=Chitinophaga nivalis TaxID=2991709 RepID=A0ABT3IU65_9BACT|nr:DUF3375 domain-containing protein [Chitinophaga nivalis]MCW3462835.1 DUF3375 domain-containing protein [Chitinophaga nivalis]MCW3487475.1 DUF3375 domain-containing protein [Chitinophaga nivalis]
MTYDQLCNLYAHSVTLKILRARSAPMMLSFFHYTFKEKNHTTISNVELVTRLSDYLGQTGYQAADDEIDAGHLLEHNDVKARQYIDQWSNKGFLRKYPDDDGLDIHELSSDMEKAMHWVSTLRKREFVGTESRFKDIFSKLKELIDQSNKDPQQRIQELERKKFEIEQEIKSITITGKVQVFDDTQIKERFYDVNRMSRELLSDFKEVEHNFEQITQEIYRKQSERDVAKGTLLAYTLDSFEALQQKDQGKSFYSFWQFLMDENKQEEMRELIEKLYSLLEDRNIEYKNDRFLKKLKQFLHASGKKVIDANKKLSDKLSRVLSENNLTDRRKATELINEIRQLAFQALEQPPGESFFIDIESDPEIDFLDRWELADEKKPNVEVSFPEGMGGTHPDAGDFDALFNHFNIDRALLEDRIATQLENKKQISLKELVDIYGTEKGLTELITYFAIASQSPHHIILETADPVVLGNRTINMPMVLFTNSQN